MWHLRINILEGIIRPLCHLVSIAVTSTMTWALILEATRSEMGTMKNVSILPSSLTLSGINGYSRLVWLAVGLCLMSAIVTDARNFSFLSFLCVFVCFSFLFFFSVPFPKARENFSLIFTMKTWQGFCSQKSVEVCGLETGLLGVFNYQTKFIFRTQKFIKIATCIFLPVSNGTPLQYSCLENPMDGGAW